MEVRVTRLLPPLVLLLFAVSSAAEPFGSTYREPDSPPVVITNVTVLSAAGEKIENGYVVVEGGDIAEVGSGPWNGDSSNLLVSPDGSWLTPGIIDVHSHLGNYPSPSYESHSDGNESTAPVTAEVWTEHSVWPQDPGFPLALAGGVTAMQVLPGSANLIGGRGVTLKNVPGRSVMDMKYPGAPHGLKMACGENPKRVYGNRKQSPATRMGNVAGYRQAWADAKEYRQKWKEYHESVEKAEENIYKEDKAMPRRNLQMESLVGVLEGNIRVHNHCYRADEMAVMIEISKEFGYKIAAFHHGVEAYKIADLLEENGICAAIWADWWRFKMEAFDGIKENIALVEKAGACAIVHSDSPWGIQRLNQEAAKALAAGRKMGMNLDEADAIRWITINAARSLGIDATTGSVEKGKDADLVIWNQNPFSVYAKVSHVFVDGTLRFDRSKERRRSDFELGHRSDEL